MGRRYVARAPYVMGARDGRGGGMNMGRGPFNETQVSYLEGRNETQVSYLEALDRERIAREARRRDVADDNGQRDGGGVYRGASRGESRGGGGGGIGGRGGRGGGGGISSPTAQPSYSRTVNVNASVNASLSGGGGGGGSGGLERCPSKRANRGSMVMGNGKHWLTPGQDHRVNEVGYGLNRNAADPQRSWTARQQRQKEAQGGKAYQGNPAAKQLSSKQRESRDATGNEGGDGGGNGGGEGARGGAVSSTLSKVAAVGGSAVEGKAGGPAGGPAGGSGVSASSARAGGEAGRMGSKAQGERYANNDIDATTGW
jgi:hypothetical protein